MKEVNEQTLKELSKIIAERTLENEGVYVITEEEGLELLKEFFGLGR